MGNLSGDGSLAGALWPPGSGGAGWPWGGGTTNGATPLSTVCIVWDSADDFEGESARAAAAFGCLNPATSASMATPATPNTAIFPVGLFRKLTASRAFTADLTWVEPVVLPATRWFPSVWPERR